MSLRLPPPEGLTSRHIGAQPVSTTTLAQSMGERDEHALMAKKQ